MIQAPIKKYLHITLMSTPVFITEIKHILLHKISKLCSIFVQKVFLDHHGPKFNLKQGL